MKLIRNKYIPATTLLFAITTTNPVLANTGCSISDRGEILVDSTPLLTVNSCNANVPNNYQEIQYEGIQYADAYPEEQFLNIYVPTTTGDNPDTTEPGPYPVYLYAHSNGSDACNIGTLREDILGSNFAIVSWESLPNIGPGVTEETGCDTKEQVRATRDDAALVLAFLRANRDANELADLDLTNIVVGGRSRGSGVSWELAHSNDPVIKGLYMPQTLPDGFWPDVNPDVTEDDSPLVNITENSMPLYMTYLPGAGEPVLDDDGTVIKIDSHDPQRGLDVQTDYVGKGLVGFTTVLTNVRDLFGDFNDFVSNLAITEPGFYDDFAGGELSSSYTNLGAQWDINNVDVARVNDTNLPSFLLNGQADWDNYSVSARLKTNAQRDLNSNYQVARLVARYENNANYYEAFIRGNGELVLRVRDSDIINGKQDLAVIQTNVAPSSWNKIEMRITGYDIELYLNDESQGTYTDPYSSNARGLAGARTLFCKCRMDNLSITLL